MKAIVHHQYGSPDVLHLEDADTPTAKPNELLVEVHASPVTQGDRRLRAADFPGMSALVGRLMFGIFRPRHAIPGTNFAGVVVSIGSDVTQFKVGDAVFGSSVHGAYAHYLAVAEASPVTKIPAEVSFLEAAAVPYGAATALAFLRDVAQLQAGERVLIVGASGAVGRFAVQIARHMGAHVTGVCRGQHAALVTELGAHEVIDYELEDYTQQTATYDVIFDTVSGDQFRRAESCLAPHGRYLTVYLNLRVLAQMLWTSLRRRKRVLSSVVLGHQALTADVAQLLQTHASWPVIVSSHAFKDMATAHRALETEGSRGTVVVAVAS